MPEPGDAVGETGLLDGQDGGFVEPFRPELEHDGCCAACAAAAEVEYGESTFDGEATEPCVDELYFGLPDTKVNRLMSEFIAAKR